MTDPVRVLIVDDQEAFRSAARFVVELTDGFSVVGEAGSGEEGVSLAAELTPDLVLMDMSLPGIDGPEATRRILLSRPETMVIGLSTYDEYRDRAMEAGAVVFVSKSEFGPESLISAWSS